MTQPAIEVCKCCGAVIPPKEGVRLSPTKQKIYDFVARHPGCTTQQIHEHLYYHREDGGAEIGTVHVMISQINKQLTGHKIKSSHPGWWATYRLIKLEDPA